MDALPVSDEKYVKAKIRTYGDKVYTNFRVLNVPEDGVKCVSFTVIYIDPLPAYNNKYYLQVYLDDCTYKIVNTQMIDYLDHNRFESDKN